MRTLRLLLILSILPLFYEEAHGGINWCVTPEGTGKHAGNGWSNALDGYTFLINCDGASFKEDTFNLAKGVYSIPVDDPNHPFKTNLRGGYSTEDPYDRNPSKQESVLSGTVSSDPEKCFTIHVEAPSESEITLDGVVLESIAEESVIISSSGEGSAVILKGCVLRKAAPKVCPNEPVVSHVYDTIYYGATSPIASNEKFDTKRIGCFEETEELTGADGCDSISYHHVVILPTSLPGNFNVFYVKMEGSGEANGSSWADAMSAKDFAFALDKVNDGAIFNMAAGDYSPEYEDCNGKHNIYRCGKVISVKGGYSENPEDGEIPNISRNLTRFILKEDNSSSVLFDLSPNLVASSTFSGIRFVSKKSSGEEAANDTLLYFHSDVYGEKIWFDSCSFSGAALSLVVDSCEFYATDTDFGDGDLLFNGMYNKSNAIVRRCSGKSIELSGNSIAVLNSTFENASLVRTDTVNIAFNTFLSMSCGEETNYTSLSCNIIAERRNAAGLLHSVFNLIALDEVQSSASSAEVSNDIIVDKDMLASVLDDKMVNNRGAFTRTFALKSDVLPNGKSLRVNHLPSDLNGVDQCGTSRLDSTCLGAFEYECVVVPLEDTICWIGKVDYVYTGADGNIIHQFSVDLQDVKLEMADGTKKSLGVRDVYEKRDTVRHENWTSPDTVFVKRFIALPKADTINTALHYYVKQDSAGTGDGSSWANAMSDSSFAFAFGKVPSGSTFHMAEGKYFPYNDSCGGLSFSSDDLKCRMFYTKNLVNIIGGYPKNAQENAVPDTSNHTVFCTEFKMESATYSTIKMFVFEPSTPGVISMSGVEFNPIQLFKGMSVENCGLRVKTDVDGVVVNLKQCRFNGSGQAVLLDSCSLRAEECDFDENNVYVIERENDETVLDRCSGDRLLLNGGSSRVTNVTFSNLDIVGNSVAYVENATLLSLGLSPSQKISLVGNIIGRLQIDVEMDMPNVTSSNNLYGIGEEDNLALSMLTSSTHDIMVDQLSLSSIWGASLLVDKAYNKGAFTKTIALTSDTLPDGRSIRYTRNNTSIDVDQCGFVRPDSTCPGAYEYGFTQRVIELSDTVMALDLCQFSYVLNKSNDENAYEFKFDLHDVRVPVTKDSTRALKIGDLYVWRDTIKHDESDEMYDTIFVRKISVLPKPSPAFKDLDEIHYYVKVKGSGNGDGSSWENAMSNESFIFAIDTVTDGSTFHFAAGEYLPTKETLQVDGSYYPSYWTNRAVNLIGGYVAEPKDGAKANPGTDSTAVYFSGGNVSRGILIYDLKSDASIKISGIEFVKGTCYKGESDSYSLHIQAPENVTVNAVIDSCTFASNRVALMLQHVSADIYDCIFEDKSNNSYHCAMGTSKGSDVKIASSVFTGNGYLMTMDSDGSINLTNCTFANNKLSGTNTELDLRGDVTLLNNTFFNPVKIESGKNSRIYGNVFESGISLDHVDTVKCRYNVIRSFNCMNYDVLDMDDNYVVTEDEHYKRLFSYDSISPVLADNGGFTKTVEMVSDKWYTFELRVPQSVTNVSVDQRGVKRYKLACVGAYEMSDYSHQEMLSDTSIVAGDDIDGVVFEKIGLATWSKEVTNADNSQIVYARNVVVLPKSDGRMNYYVKKDGVGDGSSWKKAMSDTAFAYAFGKVNSGSTFHVAEGVYHPMYDKNGDMSGELAFYSDSINNIKGGYPKGITSPMTADPSKYRAVLSGDLKDDDEKGIYISDANQADNTHNVLLYTISSAGTLHLSGLDLQGATTNTPPVPNALLTINATVPQVAYEVMACDFKQSCTAMVSSNCSGAIENCSFSTINYNDILADGSATDSIRLKSNSFEGHFVQLDQFASCLIENCTFANDTVVKKSTLSISNISTENVKLVHNTFLGSIDLTNDVAGAELKGNIIAGYVVAVPTSNIQTFNNLYVDVLDYPVENSFSDYGVTNIPVSKSELHYLMESDDDWFVVKNNGGYTKTVALLSDSLPNKGSIRLPRLYDVKYDQIGHKRYDYTCPGAYELSGLVITDTIADTCITLDKSFAGVTYEKIGSYMVNQVLTNEDGSKTILWRKINVLPLSDGHLNYYVRQNGAGTGDGSSWKNAMSDSAFAFAFGKVPNGSTFHVEEGTYYPFDMDGEKKGLDPKGFYTDSVVSIIAGYSNYGKKRDKLSVLSGYMETKEWAYHVPELIHMNNLGGNADVTISGVEFKNGADNKDLGFKNMTITILGKESASFHMTKCKFDHIDSVSIVTALSGKIDTCDFDLKEKPVEILCSASGNLMIDASSFDCFTYLKCKKAQLQNNSFVSLELMEPKADVSLIHNTLFKLSLRGGNVETQRNLVAEFNVSAEYNGHWVSSYNLIGNALLGEYKDSIGVTDTIVREASFKTLLRNEGGSFVMDYANSFTKTFELLKDTLPNGVLIRIPVHEKIKKDQLDSLRYMMTCPGACELKGYTKYRTYDTTIFVKGVVHNRVYNNIGKFLQRDSVIYPNGSIDVSIITVYVLPMHNGHGGYYVKQHGSGNKSGSSWDNAMTDSSFAFAFGRVDNDVTFYMAEGSYSPLYDSNLEPIESDTAVPTFFTTKRVNIQGGYDAKEKDESALPDPQNGRTIFLRSGSLDSMQLASDSIAVITYRTKSAGNIAISGVAFDASLALSIDAENTDTKLSIENTLFKNGVGVKTGTLRSLTLNGVTFDSTECGIRMEKSTQMSVTNSTFGGDPESDGEQMAFVLPNGYSERCALTFNTILSTISIPATGSYSWMGNIFAAPIISSERAQAKVESSFNLYMDSERVTSSDIAMNVDGLRQIFGESYDLVDGLGFTPVLPLQTDVLPTGDIIRFYLENSDVKVDQTGGNRKFMTCMGSYEYQIVSDLTIPTAFTPYTQDGVNDRFMPGFQVYIYDRLGRLISYSMNGWDGKYDNEFADPGVYVYVLWDANGEVHKGTVEILKQK